MCRDTQPAFKQIPLCTLDFSCIPTKCIKVRKSSVRFQSRQKVSKIHFHICAHYDGAWANETIFILSQLKNTQKRSFSKALAILDTHQSICSCTTILFFYPFVWVESWVWKAWLTLLWAFGDTRVLCATCQRLNDGSQSTQLSLCGCAWTVCAPVWVCVWLYIWMWLCVS